MTIVEVALLEMATVLDDLQIRYMLIGGVAVGLWGEPRATLDVDLTLWVESGKIKSVLEALGARVKLRTMQPQEIVRRTHVLPAVASNGVLVDLLFAAWPIEKQAIDRAVTRHISGKQVRIAPLDYLLFLKLISDRPKDLADAEALILRHRGKFDVAWLQSELSALAESMAQPEILQRFENLLAEERPHFDY